MKQADAPDTGFTRRHALGFAGAAGLCAVVPSTLMAGGAAFEETVAGYARAVAQGRSISLKLLLPQGAGGNVAPVISAFTKMTGIEIIAIEKPVQEINVELLLGGLGRAQLYDIALPATYGLPDLASVGAIEPITKFAAKYEPPGFRQNVLFDVGDTFDRDIYGFQTDGDAYLMFYNKTMLESPDEKARYADRFGKPLERPETWDDLDRQMAFFNRPEENQWGGLLFRTPDYLAWEWWVRFHAKGVWPFSPEMEPQIASDAGVQALEEMIRATRNLCPEVATLNLFENWERFSRGDVFCNIGWGGTQKYLNGPTSKIRGNMVYGPTPGGMSDGELIVTPYFNWGWNYVIPSQRPEPELSYLFALFAATPAMSGKAVQQTDGFFDPFRKEHYDDPKIQDAYTPEFLVAHRESLENAIPDLYLKGQGDYFRVLGEWLVKALSNEVSPQQALARVAQRWQLTTTSAGRAAQIKRWAHLRQKYPAHLSAKLRDYS